jgi:hypothetical protein
MFRALGPGVGSPPEADKPLGPRRASALRYSQALTEGPGCLR